LPATSDEAPATGVAVEVSSALIWSGVAAGCSWTRRAASPETTAVDSEVPLPRNQRLPTSAVEPYSSSITDPGSRRLSIEVPGATTSGLRLELPALEKGATPRLLPLPWLAPTART
jgi:hypothetical protein